MTTGRVGVGVVSHPDPARYPHRFPVFGTSKMLVGGAADASLWLLLATYGLGAYLLQRLGSVREVWRTRPFLGGLAWGFGAARLLLAVLLAPGGEKPPFIYCQF